MALEHAILVALLEQPGSGYELARRFERSIGRFWTATHQQIYRVLGRMEGDGWVRSEQVTQQGLRVAEEAAEQTDKALRQGEKAAHEVELRTAVSSALGTASYDELSVAEVSRRLEGLSTDQLQKVREFEKNNKNRETLIEQIDRKIRANS